MKNSRRSRIIDQLRTRMSDVEVLAVLEKEFPLSVLLTSNKQALAGTKWDLATSGRSESKQKFNRTS